MSTPSSRYRIERMKPSSLASGDPGPGEYAPLRKDGLEVNAFIGCPGCARCITISEHAVTPDGRVNPSLDCPFDDCEFHEFVRLADWNPGETT